MLSHSMSEPSSLERWCLSEFNVRSLVIIGLDLGHDLWGRPCLIVVLHLLLLLCVPLPLPQVLDILMMLCHEPHHSLHAALRDVIPILDDNVGLWICRAGYNGHLRLQGSRIRPAVDQAAAPRCHRLKSMTSRYLTLVLAFFYIYYRHFGDVHLMGGDVPINYETLMVTFPILKYCVGSISKGCS